MSVSDLTYPGNAQSLPRKLPSPLPALALWWCELAGDDASAAALSPWLSEPERMRASRFGRAALARRYIVGRASLRWVLGQRLGIPPAAVPIERGERGRPQLAGVEPTLDFNVSNTRDAALIGILESSGSRVGVDLEHGSRQLDHAGLGRKYLTERERDGLATLDEDARRLAFLRLWTCKEAISKATGEALAAPLRRLDVSLTPALSLANGPPPYLPDAWTLAPAAVPDEYLATVAIWRCAAAGSPVAPPPIVGKLPTGRK